MSALDYLLSRTLPIVPKPIVRWASRPYIAGEHLPDALRVTRSLNRSGYLATLDVLGESVTSQRQVEGAVADYLQALTAIRGEGLQANISVKLTQLGLKIHPDLCLASVKTLVQAARDQANFVRIDMEDSTCTSPTLEIYRALRASGLTNVGVVLQASLRRSLKDARELPEGANVRICKGIYVEPRALAFRDRELVNKNYIRILEEMLERGFYVGIATHDEDLVWEAQRIVERRRLSPDRYEFQMLLGVDEELRGLTQAAGHRLRVYIPFGVNWYAYSLRRLKENPRIAGYVARSLLGGGG